MPSSRRSTRSLRRRSHSRAAPLRDVTYHADAYLERSPPTTASVRWSPAQTLLRDCHRSANALQVSHGATSPELEQPARCRKTRCDDELSTSLRRCRCGIRSPRRMPPFCLDQRAAFATGVRTDLVLGLQVFVGAFTWVKLRRSLHSDQFHLLMESDLLRRARPDYPQGHQRTVSPRPSRQLAAHR